MAITQAPIPITDPRLFLRLNGDQLDQIFRISPPGDIPVGEGEGAAIIAPGTSLTETAAKFIHLVTWKGKVFEHDEGDPGRGWLKNRLFLTGTQAIVAHVYKGESWLDGKECIVLDYSHSSLVAQWIRDEIRLAGAGIYLGIVFWGKQQSDAHRLIHFSLKFPVPG
jgi:hypothetical protein